MRSTTIVAAVSGLLFFTAPAASALPTPTISQTSIGGARLGLTTKAYRAIFGRPVLTDRLEEGYTRLTFPKSRVEIYLPSSSNAGVAVSTYGSFFKMASGVGPCSPAADLTRIYGKRLERLSKKGSVTLYRLGNLVFRVFGTHVTAVTLGRGPLALQVAANSSDCPG